MARKAKKTKPPKPRKKHFDGNVAIDVPGAQGNVAEYFQGFGQGFLCGASGTITADEFDLLDVLVVNRFDSSGIPAPPAATDNEALQAWFYEHGLPATYEFQGGMVHSWELDESLSALCEVLSDPPPSPLPADNNTIHVGAILRDGPAASFVDANSADYLGIRVEVCSTQFKESSSDGSSGKEALPYEKFGPWLIYRGIPVDAPGKGVRLMESGGQPLRATTIEVMASHVQWTYQRPLPVSVYRPSGLTLSAAGPGWALPRVSPGSIVLSQHLGPLKPNVVLAEAEKPLSQLVLTPDQFSFLAGRDIYAQVNYPLASLDPATRTGSYDLHVRVIA